MNNLKWIICISLILSIKSIGISQSDSVNVDGKNLFVYKFDVLKNVQDPIVVEAIDMANESLLGINGIALYQNLQYLKLNGNHELGRFSGVDRLKKLKQLYLIDCNLTQIPDEFKGLVSLKVLYLNTNNFTSIDPLLTLQNLEQLDLMNCKLKEIPKGFSNLKNLKKIYLYNNSELNNIDHLVNLKNLEYIHLSFCNVSKIPDSISTLTSLKSIYFYNNDNLQHVDALGYVTSLEHINLDECDVKKIPSSFSNLKSLKTLYLYDNVNLVDISPLFELKNLQELDITNCKVPQDQIKKLMELNPTLSIIRDL